MDDVVPIIFFQASTLTQNIRTDKSSASTIHLQIFITKHKKINDAKLIMPTYEISSCLAFSPRTSYEMINVKDEDDAFDAEAEFFRWGYGAKMDHDEHGSIELSENWDWSFKLLDEHHGRHYMPNISGATAYWRQHSRSSETC
jgi:hypothetical protein